jgi:hypothetical protein
MLSALPQRRIHLGSELVNGVLRPTTGQALRLKKLSHKDGQPQPRASASLGQVHSSKVSKAAREKMPRPQQRRNISQEVSAGTLPLSSGVDAAEPQPSPEHATPRRSKRIQPYGPSVAKDPTRTASMDPSKRAVRSKTVRNVANHQAHRLPEDKTHGSRCRLAVREDQGRAAATGRGETGL